MSASQTPRRRLRPLAALLVALTIGIAVLTLLGLEPVATLPAELNQTLSAFSQLLIQIVAVIGAIALLLGVVNLMRFHAEQLRKFPRGLYSLILLVTLLGVLIVRALERGGVLRVGDGEAPALSLTLLDVAQVAVESALASLLFFALVYGAVRLMRRRVTIWNALFLAALVIVLLGFSPLGGATLLPELREWLLSVPVGAGTRGLLIGVALGVVVVGVRVLIGRDRTFRE
ncbi:MAG: hypothetical protein CUN51_07185 [Candidatus Thermofonsia Clade 1 bacterium]|uniref:Uncharacterized protein n=1 Tax=Candidatus Thermofonsia Clade 1 bacterium TaxID=2364210 RepID=A0A2M8NZ57_9CHLR|nr:MAG: hypothetical protein CUN51_07185 [Candidatus Thermofonsia Clade 1 bacterium]